MIIKSLIVQNKTEGFSFDFSKYTQIYSERNSQGKTSLIRFIIYGLGYNIPITSGINPDGYKVKLTLSLKNEEIKMIREKNSVFVTKPTESRTISVTDDNNYLLSYIFESTNNRLLSNILGTFYIDQERGWVIFNRGNVIGRQNFSIDELLYGLQNLDTDIFTRKREIGKQIENYSNVLKLYNANIPLEDFINHYDTIDGKIVDFNKSIDNLTIELNTHKKIKNSYLNIKKQNKEMWNYINSLGLYIVINDQRYKLTKDIIEGLDENTDYIDAKIKNEEIQIAAIQNEINKINEKIKELYSKGIVLSKIKIKPVTQCLKIDIKTAEIQLRVLKDQKKEIEEEIKTNTSNSEYKTLMNQYLENYCNELGISNILDKDRLIQSSDFSKITGAESQKLLLAYRCAMLRTTSEYLDVNLPLIIDSINRETDKESLDMMLRFIFKEFSEHQIILSTLEKTDYFRNIINIDDKLMKPIDKLEKVKRLGV